MGAGPAEQEWFDVAFGEVYDLLYEHRDDEDAGRDADRILAHGVDVGARVVDLACGNGRHLEVLAARRADLRAVGIDRSSHLLDLARRRLGAHARLARGDLRALPFASGSFDLALNLFTSFGYFDSDAEHERAICEMRRVLAPGGWLHLDHIDAAALAASLAPESRVERAGRQVCMSRRIEGDHVKKRIRSDDGVIDHEERVRLWSPAGMRALLEASGFEVEQVALSNGRMHVWAQSARSAS